MRRGRRAKPIEEAMSTTLHMRVSRSQLLNLDTAATALDLPPSTLARHWLIAGAASAGLDLNKPSVS